MEATLTWFTIMSGSYPLEDYYPGTGGIPEASTEATLLITNLDNQAFSVSSNSTVSVMDFNLTTKTLSKMISKN